MKNKKTTLVTLFIISGLLMDAPSFAQIWSGSTSTTGEIYRPGWLAVGSYCSSGYIGQSALEVNQTDDTYWSALFYNGGGSGQGLRIKGAFYNSTTPLLQVEANNSSGGSLDVGNMRFLVQANGAVGIGTELVHNPNSYLLAVQGTIGTYGVTIESSSPTWSWPDYVFEKNYKLMPLSDVKKYIEANKHLPDVASEADIKKNGINVAETDKQLLKKIEELTLYSISLQEQNAKLEKRVTRIESVTPELRQSAGIFGGNDIGGILFKLLGGLGIALSGFVLFKRNRSNPLMKDRGHLDKLFLNEQ